jgi:hypothetical protein
MIKYSVKWQFLNDKKILLGKLMRKNKYKAMGYQQLIVLKKEKN